MAVNGLAISSLDYAAISGLKIAARCYGSDLNNVHSDGGGSNAVGHDPE
jgi:hypothetical protein